MALCYNKLWKLLIDRGMTRTQMRLAADISTTTLAKLSKGEDVNTSILVKICNAMQCNIGDIADFVPDEDPKREATNETTHAVCRPGCGGVVCGGRL